LKTSSKRFGKVTAVNHVSLEIKHGEFFTFLGPSGCGKTTTLRVIAGLEIADEGRIFFDNVDVTDYPPYKRNTGMVFQNYALWPHMTVFDNIAYGLKLKKLPKEEIRRKVKEVIDFIKLSGMEDRYPTQLSGGQQQRVALARALVVEPKVLLLDEPLSNLDAKVRVDIRGFLKELQRKLKMTAIHVTHDQEEAMALADEIILIHDGKIVEKAPPKQLYEKPRTLFAFKFIGLSNVIPASLMGLTDSDYVGFRPEDVEVVSRDGDISGVVRTVQHFGSYQIIEVILSKDVIIRARLSPNASIKEGQKISLKVTKFLKFKDEKVVD
jgi:ABC-type Fe3+/spermidine/putrescine transport system ATPase subunit